MPITPKEAGASGERGDMRRHELTDQEWALIADLMPRSEGPGRPWNDHRQTVNGMMWILKTGAPWRDLPEHYGPWQSVFDRFNRWRKNGMWDRVLERLHLRLDKEGRIDWDVWMVDSTNVRATRAAAGAVKGGTPENPRITRWAAREVGLGPKSTWSVTVVPFRSAST